MTGIRKQSDGDVRCGCGGLMARLVGGSAEIKCRHCRRIVRLPLEGSDTTGSEDPAR